MGWESLGSDASCLESNVPMDGFLKCADWPIVFPWEPKLTKPPPVGGCS